MPTTAIDRMIEATIGAEGGYSNHPSDAGGETMWGITADTARRNGYTKSMKSLSRDAAVAIYRNEFLIRPGFGRVAELSEAVATELFDTGVNMGPSVPALWFQQWINALNRQGHDYADIPEDGDIGAKTLGALGRLIAVRGKASSEVVMLKGLNCSQGARYLELARRRAANEDFVFGWLANRVGLADGKS